MRLWSIQTEEVYNKLMQNGEVIAQINKSDTLEYGKCQEFTDAYKWLIDQMEKRGIRKPNGYETPWWAWYKINGENKLTSEIEYLCTPDMKFKLLELEVPDKDVLLSDYNKWHYVINKWWLDDSTCEKEWDENMDWFDTLPYCERYKVMECSWQKIFNIEKKTVGDNWDTNGLYVQAVFWRLKKEYVKNVTDIIGKELEE